MIQLTLPEEIYPELFIDAALSQVMKDGKMLSDAIPKLEPALINKAYEVEKTKPGFDFLKFIDQYFVVLKPNHVFFESDTSQSTFTHVDRLWELLTRNPDIPVEGSSLIALPFKYVVPGGRFNEIYYWDSYFTMLGLKVSERFDLIESMIDNFAYLINEVGFIPNGNRSYFLSRSQPPFFSLMIELLVAEKGNVVYAKYISVLQKEYGFWMEGKDELSEDSTQIMHIVRLGEDEYLNRYWDSLDTPRSEMYQDDIHLSKQSKRNPNQLFKDLRSACESGWDFSSRWCEEPNNLTTIKTSEIIPVDLNCLLYNLEKTLAEAFDSMGDESESMKYHALAEKRNRLIAKYFWDEKTGYFYDYNFRKQRQTSSIHVGGIFTLSFGICPKEDAHRCLNFLKTHLLNTCGVLTTTCNSGQQWDAPNGWAPLQWMSFLAALVYDNESLANEIAVKWTSLNEKVFEKTGKMMEKYNVQDADLESGGGEYPVQDGFGWTNGVYLAMKDWLNKR